MCRAVKCQQCSKTGWAGCGAHVEQVLANVPKSERCKCHEQPKKAATDKPGRTLASLFGFK
jgi:hypothetical protein